MEYFSKRRSQAPSPLPEWFVIRFGVYVNASKWLKPHHDFADCAQLADDDTDQHVDPVDVSGLPQAHLADILTRASTAQPFLCVYAGGPDVNEQHHTGCGHQEKKCL